MIGPSAAAFVSRIAPAEEQGRALGLLQSVGAVARIGGPILAGVVAGHASARVAFFVASGAAGLAGVSAMIHPPEPRGLGVSEGGRRADPSGSP